MILVLLQVASPLCLAQASAVRFVHVELEYVPAYK